MIGNIASWVVEIATDVIEVVTDVVDVLIGKTVSKSYNYTQGWQLNATGEYIDENDLVYCFSCYSSLDLTYVYEMRISSWSLDYFKVSGTGEADMAIIVDLTEYWSAEYDKTSKKIGIPYLSFTVFGVTFGFDIYGALGTGVSIDIDFSIFGGKVSGSISRGIEETSSSLLLSVKDEGPGFAETSPQKIFKRFYSNRPTSFGKHSGLGLNIVKNIVQLHKGTIAASNRLNTKGAQVEVLLPKLC